MYPVIFGPQPGDPSAVKVAKLINSLDNLVHSRETPNEIYLEVKELADAFRDYVVEWAREREINTFIEGFAMLAQGYVHYVYLIAYGDAYPRPVYIYRFAKRHDEAMLKELLDPREFNDLAFRKTLLVHLDYLRLCLKGLKKVSKEIFEPYMQDPVGFTERVRSKARERQRQEELTAKAKLSGEDPTQSESSQLDATYLIGGEVIN